MRKPDDEDLTEQVKIMLSRRILRDVQDLALLADRSVSAYIRHVLDLHIYGHGAIVQEMQKKSMDRKS